MASFYEYLDSIFLGLLPGGAAPGSLPLMPQPIGGTAPTTSPLAGLTGMAPAGPPTVRGRIVTATIRLVQGQQPQVVKVVPGGVSLYARDMGAYKRVLRLARKARGRVYRRKRR